MSSRLEKIKLLATLVPDYTEESYKILAVWYFKRKRLTLCQAVKIGGFKNTEHLDQFSKGSGKEHQYRTWTTTARFFHQKLQSQQHKKDGFTNFKNWISVKYADPRAVLRIMRVEKIFRGSGVEQLTFQKARLLSRLDNTNIQRLKKTGVMIIRNKKYSIEQIDRMKYLELFLIVFKRGGTGLKPVPPR